MFSTPIPDRENDIRLPQMYWRLDDIFSSSAVTRATRGFRLWRIYTRNFWSRRDGRANNSTAHSILRGHYATRSHSLGPSRWHWARPDQNDLLCCLYREETVRLIHAELD